MSLFLEEYNNAKNSISDINEHIETLYNLALECDHVTEMGTRHGTSTRAFLHANPKKLIAYDTYTDQGVLSLFSTARENGRDQQFINANVREIEIEETDLLFIDTWHAGEQIRIELEKHGNKARKYLAFHDVITYGFEGEGNPEGILMPIMEFINNNRHWKIKEFRTNNNGLLVLQKA